MQFIPSMSRAVCLTDVAYLHEIPEPRRASRRQVSWKDGQRTTAHEKENEECQSDTFAVIKVLKAIEDDSDESKHKLIRSHQYSLEKKRALQSASSWLRSIGRSIAIPVVNAKQQKPADNNLSRTRLTLQPHSSVTKWLFQQRRGDFTGCR